MEESSLSISTKLLKRIVYISCAVLTIPIVVYILNFWDHGLSENPADWGALGDYFSLVLNGLSLMATIYIAFLISHLDDKRSKEALKYDREKLLSEMRQAEYQRIMAEFHLYLELIPHGKSNEEIVKGTFRICMQFSSFRQNNGHLFDFLNEPAIVKLDDGLSDLLNFVSDTTPSKESNENLSSKMGEIIKSMMKFSSKTQTFILDKMQLN